ncbi:hypothetical protein H1Q63_19195 [Desmonostoc muscorum CCALA 125]|nr:hypothetical protein [Desmonostoc muscorum CCALA 125]
MPTNATTLPLKRQMERRKFLNKIASYEERPQTDNPLFIGQLRYLDLATSTEVQMPAASRRSDFSLFAIMAMFASPAYLYKV